MKCWFLMRWENRSTRRKPRALAYNLKVHSLRLIIFKYIIPYKKNVLGLIFQTTMGCFASHNTFWMILSCLNCWPLNVLQINGTNFLQKLFDFKSEIFFGQMCRVISFLEFSFKWAAACSDAVNICRNINFLVTMLYDDVVQVMSYAWLEC